MAEIRMLRLRRAGEMRSMAPRQCFSLAAVPTKHVVAGRAVRPARPAATDDAPARPLAVLHRGTPGREQPRRCRATPAVARRCRALPGAGALSNAAARRCRALPELADAPCGRLPA